MTDARAPERGSAHADASIGRRLDARPFTRAHVKVLTGSGECATVDWTLLGLSMPQWTLLLFLGLGVVGVVGNWRQRNRRPSDLE